MPRSVPPPRRKYIGGCRSESLPGPPTHMMLGRRAARDEEDPHVFVRAAALVPIAPSQIVQGVFDRLTERRVDAVGEQAIEPGALVDFVEMWEGLAGADDFAPRILHRRPVGTVESALDEIRGGEQILQTLLVLDTNGVAAEFVGDATGGDVGLALPEHLVLGQLGGLVFAKMKFESLGEIPFVNGARLFVANLGGAIVERSLREALLVDAGFTEPAHTNTFFAGK
jgi:hypothetical protein